MNTNSFLSNVPTWLLFIIVAIALLDVVLKLLAIYKAARLSEKGWFVALFILNTAGILPAIYLIVKRDKK